jgi:carotenoid epsilon hydroxylase
MEAVVALAVLLKRFNIKLVPGQTPGMTTGATIHTVNGLYVTLTERSKDGNGSGEVLPEPLQRIFV